MSSWLLPAVMAWLACGAIGAALLRYPDPEFDLGTVAQILIGPYALAIGLLDLFAD